MTIYAPNIYMNDFDIIPKPTSHKKKKKKVKQEKEDLEYLLKVEFFLLERKCLSYWWCIRYNSVSIIVICF